MTEGSTQTVTATQFQQAVGKYIDDAAKGPVVITKHRRPARVLIDAAEYDRLKALDLRRAYYAEELGDDVLNALQAANFDHIDPALDRLMDQRLAQVDRR
jgi:prevent-host-death family protein